MINFNPIYIFNAEEKRLRDEEDDEVAAATALYHLKDRKTDATVFVDNLTSEDLEENNDDVTLSPFNSYSDEEHPIETPFSYFPVNPFFKGKVKHPTREIQIIFTRIIAEASKKEEYQQMNIAKFLKAYEAYAAAEPKTDGDVNYDSVQERNFLERILTVFFKEKSRFDTEFDFVRSRLVRGYSDRYALTAKKLKEIRIGIEGHLIDPILAKGMGAAEFEKMFNQGYNRLLQYA